MASVDGARRWRAGAELAPATEPEPSAHRGLRARLDREGHHRRPARSRARSWSRRRRSRCRSRRSRSRTGCSRTPEEHKPTSRGRVGDIVRRVVERRRHQDRRASSGKERLDQYQRAFGFGSKTAIDFPAESAGLMKHVGRVTSPRDMGSVPIGYTTAVTPMQMLDVFTTVAQRRRHPAAAARGGDDRRGRHPPRPCRADAGQPRREREDRGRAERDAARRGAQGRHRRAGRRSPATPSPGKTGTSRKPPYEPTPRYMASFAGFAPAESRGSRRSS